MPLRTTARLRKQVFDRAKGQCEYCRSQALYTTETFEMEHIMPLARGGETLFDNLALSCSSCNGRKSDKIEADDPLTGRRTALFHPRKEEWTHHFCWKDEGDSVEGLTAVGRASVSFLQMNRLALKNWRQVMRLAGLHPPVEATL